MTFDPTLHLRIIDAIASDIEQNAELPRHNLLKYQRPIIVLPEDCPLLCVWLVGKQFQPQTTNAFYNRVTIGVSWQDETVGEALTLIDDVEAAKKLIVCMAKIEARMRHLGLVGVSPDILEAFELIPASVDFVPPQSLDTGLVEGYAMTVQVGTLEDS